MAVLIVALALPQTIEFVTEKPNDETESTKDSKVFHGDDKDLDSSDTATDRPEIQPDVPFDFKFEPKRAQPASRHKPQVANKEIVDTRKEQATTQTFTVNMTKSSHKAKPIAKEEAIPRFRRLTINSRPRSLSQSASHHRRSFSPMKHPSLSGGLSRRRTIRGGGDQFNTNQPWKLVRQVYGNGGLYNAIDCAVNKGVLTRPMWVGLLGVPTDALSEATKQQIALNLETLGSYVVYVTDNERYGHYVDYCKDFLWPTFHCQTPDNPKNKSYEDYSWGDYCQVNQAIADKVCDLYEPGDTIWIHDYHLMLVPEMVRKKRPDAEIGFFLHIAFPTSEVFRCLAYRSDILRGLLGANCLAFQNAEYKQHFMMAVSRILAVDVLDDRILTPERDIKVIACHIGVDPTRLDELKSSPSVMKYRKNIRRKWPDIKIIGSRNKTDVIRGDRQKLKAFGQFLSNHPQWAYKAVFIQICQSSSGTFESEAELSSIADSINSQYGDIAAGVHPVVFLRQDILYDQYLALLAEADAFAVTPLRDGMNLTCHEFVYCNTEEHMGPIILSEFTGSASLFGDDALLVNPWDISRLASAYHEALTMDEEERRRRWKSLLKDVTDHTSDMWADINVRAIKDGHKQDRARTSTLTDVSKFLSLYRSNPQLPRLFFLEISEPKTQAELPSSAPSPKVRPMLVHRNSYYTSRLVLILSKLLSDPKNIVYLGSSESRSDMERAFRQLPTIGLVAESGKYVRPFGGNDNWVSTGPSTKSTWMEEIGPVLKNIKGRLGERRITKHESTITVHFDEMSEEDSERRLARIGEYSSIFNSTLSGHGIYCNLTDNELTIYTSEVVETWIKSFKIVLDRAPERLGLLMAAGHTLAREKGDSFYRYAMQQKQNGRTEELITIVIDKYPTLAEFNVEGVNNLITVIEKMILG